MHAYIDESRESQCHYKVSQHTLTIFFDCSMGRWDDALDWCQGNDRRVPG
jgi:hypothetical protein